MNAGLNDRSKCLKAAKCVKVKAKQHLGQNIGRPKKLDIRQHNAPFQDPTTARCLQCTVLGYAAKRQCQGLPG